MNPIKFGMAEDVAEYRWSSYRHTALSQIDPLISEHERYQALGTSPAQRSEGYLRMYEQRNTPAQDAQITQTTLRGEVYGSENFHHKMSVLITRTTKLTSHESDRKSETYHNQVG